MAGGYQRWKIEGLPIIKTTINYEKGTVKVVADRAEVVANEFTTDPVRTLGTLAATAGVGAAVLNYEYILEWIGLLGVLISSYQYFLGPGSENRDFVDDIQNKVKSVTSTVNSITGSSSGGNQSQSQSGMSNMMDLGSKFKEKASSLLQENMSSLNANADDSTTDSSNGSGADGDAKDDGDGDGS